MRSSRRSFLQIMGASALLPMALAEERQSNKALVGSQLYGWGQYYQREGKNMGDRMDEILSAVHSCGYDYAEGSLDAANPEANGRFAQQLRSHGLKAVALYTGGRLHERSGAAKSIEQITRAAKVA